MNRKKHTCNRFRVLGNAGMVAGFLVLCVALEVGIMAEKEAVYEAGEWMAAQTAGGGSDAGGAPGTGLLYYLNWFLPRAGAALLAGGFLCKLVFWRCPDCGCHLMLCARGGGRECPCCGAGLEARGMGEGVTGVNGTGESVTGVVVRGAGVKEMRVKEAGVKEAGVEGEECKGSGVKEGASREESVKKEETGSAYS